MGYYIRVLVTSDKLISVSHLEYTLKNKGIKANIKTIKGTNKKWIQILLTNKKGEDIATIERNIVLKNSLGKKEIDEFLKEIVKCKPKSAVKWLSQYLKTVKVIYAFQILKGAFKKNDLDVIRTIQSEFWNTLGGIFQADNEGFSNEDGYHILWQFSYNIKGSWKMAILDKSGKWLKFEMDLGNKKHRKAFFDGKIPENVNIIQ